MANVDGVGWAMRPTGDEREALREWLVDEESSYELALSSVIEVRDVERMLI
jgi:hypothetical protein